MATFEMVEKIRQYANVTYDEAKAALDACNDDLLEAVIYLEKQGKVASPPPPKGQYYPSSDAGKLLVIPQPAESKQEKNARRKAAWRRFCRHVADIFGKGFTNKFEITRKGEVILAMPVIVLIALVLFCFWFTVPILILGLFLSCRYRFYGPEVEKSGANGVMDSAAETAENLKAEAQKIYEEHKAEAKTDSAASGDSENQAAKE